MPFPFRPSLLAVACAQALILTGCGGGSSSHADAGQYLQSNNNPLAGSTALGVGAGTDGAFSSLKDFSVHAGDDQQADKGVMVVLNGKVELPAGDTVSTFQWTQIAGPTVTLTGSNTATLQIQTPDVDEADVLTFRLTVTDKDGNKASDTASVAVSALKPFARMSGVTVGEGAGVAKLVVTLSEIPKKPVTLNFEVQPVTAQLGSDYGIASGEVAFAAGQQTATIEIPIINDTIPEDTESFLVKLLDNNSVGLAIETVLVNIIDDDISTDVAARALLGPISGATVTVTDFISKNVLCTTKTNASNDLTQAGRFSIPAACIKTGSPKLITISGGSDIDADDNQQLDATPTTIKRNFHAVVVPSTIDFSKELHVSAVTEAAYLRSTLTALADDNAVLANINQSAAALLKQDLNSDQKIDAADLLYWDPIQDRSKFKKALGLLDSTRDSILNGVETDTDLTNLATRLFVDPIGTFYTANSAESTYYVLNVDVSAVDNNQLYFAMTTPQGRAKFVTSAYSLNLTDPASITKTLLAPSLTNVFGIGAEAVAGNLVLRTSVGNAYGENLDIIPVAVSGQPSRGEFDGVRPYGINYFDYSQNGLVIGAQNYYDTNGQQNFLRIGEISSAGLNANVNNPGDVLDMRSSSECAATSGKGRGRIENIIYKVKVLDTHTIAAFYHSDCFYSNESSSNFQNIVGVYSVEPGNKFKLQNKVVLNADLNDSAVLSSSYDVKDAAMKGSQLYVVSPAVGLRRIDLDSGQVKETLDASINGVGTYNYQIPEEISIDGSNLYELIRNTQYVSEALSSAAIVARFDVNDPSAVKETGRLTVDGAGECAILEPGTMPQALPWLSGRTMSVSNGNLILNFSYAGMTEGTTAQNYNYLGILVFDANDVIGTKTFFSDRAFTSGCTG